MPYITIVLGPEDKLYRAIKASMPLDVSSVRYGSQSMAIVLNTCGEHTHLYISGRLDTILQGLTALQTAVGGGSAWTVGIAEVGQAIAVKRQRLLTAMGGANANL